MTRSARILSAAVLSFGCLWAASTQVRAASPEPVAFTIDATQTTEPISPYIYGQFIEHLGRCIYGGLWAEMLEDRKFFYTVDGEAPAWNMYKPGNRSWDGEGHPYELLTRSPWMIIGDKKAVSMETEKAFVGKHTPRLQLPGNGAPSGLLQERLGLVGGKRYAGRIVLAGDPGAGPIEVSLVWGGGAGDRDTVSIPIVGRKYATTAFELEAGGTTDNGRIEIVGRGKGSFLIGTVSIMPSDNIQGWRADTVALVKELDSPVYRWPGGNFVSGYNWRDGIGDRDRRPPRKNPAWKGVESNDVGIHEFLALCGEIGTEPFIAVNTGLGGAEEAAAEVEYVNGGAETKHGRLRAENGHPKPYGVKYWAVGNEMYGSWQLGHMPLSEYVKKHSRVVEAMRAVDPKIVPIAVGSVGEWSRQMLTTCADHMGLISEHLYWQDKDDVIEHVAQIRDGIRRVATAHRGYRKTIPALVGKDIRIALDEWNYWYGPNEFGELGVRYLLQDALGIAVGLHEYFRQSDLFYMANYAQTVNVIGAIKTTKTAAEFESTGLVLKLYRKRFGKTPVSISGDHAPMDIAAAWTEDRKEITLAVVNPASDCWPLALSLKGAVIAAPAMRWVITGPDRFSHNHPGRPRQVDISSDSVDIADGRIEVAPLSVTLFTIPVRPRFYDPVEKEIEGWKVAVGPRLLADEHRQTKTRAFEALANHLQRIKYIVPKDRLAQLQKLRIWIELDNPKLGNMQYHPDRGWLVSHGHDPRLVKHVHIPRARNLYDPKMWAKHPYVVLHELAHAYHDQVLSFDHPEIIAAYKDAKEKGIYDEVLLYTGAKVRHYSLSNHKEYFAESTEAYFGVNDFYPFVRAELKEHDPAMFALMEKFWGRVK